LLVPLVAASCVRDSQLPGPIAGHGGAGASGHSGAGSGGAGSGGAGAGGAGSGGAAGTAGAPSVPSLDAEQLLASSCRLDVLEAQLLPANMLFVIDRSGSMACNPPPITDSATCERDAKRASPDPSKWEITQTALVETLKILPEASRVGVSYFSNDDACGVQASPTVLIAANRPAQKDLIRTSLSTVKPSGATPLVGATILAYQHMFDQARDGFLSGNNFVVLITDGKQSDACGDPGQCTTAEECTKLLIDKEVPRAAAPGVGIRTFVIGVPGSELDRRTLSHIALAGGTPRPNCEPDKNCHFDVSSGGDFRADLGEALKSIVGQSLSCDLPVPTSNKEDLTNLVNVLYKPQNRERVLVRQDTTHPCDAGANGWQYVRNNTRIRLCGDICTQVKSDPGGQLAVVLGCPIQGPI
jgi:hypothetical protein